MLEGSHVVVERHPLHFGDVVSILILDGKFGSKEGDLTALDALRAVYRDGHVAPAVLDEDIGASVVFAAHEHRLTGGNVLITPLIYREGRTECGVVIDVRGLALGQAQRPQGIGIILGGVVTHDQAAILRLLAVAPREVAAEDGGVVKDGYQAVRRRTVAVLAQYTARGVIRLCADDGGIDVGIVIVDDDILGDDRFVLVLVISDGAARVDLTGARSGRLYLAVIILGGVAEIHLRVLDDAVVDAHQATHGVCADPTVDLGDDLTRRSILTDDAVVDRGDRAAVEGGSVAQRPRNAHGEIFDGAGGAYATEEPHVVQARAVGLHGDGESVAVQGAQEGSVRRTDGGKPAHRDIGAEREGHPLVTSALARGSG